MMQKGITFEWDLDQVQNTVSAVLDLKHITHNI